MSGRRGPLALAAVAGAVASLVVTMVAPSASTAATKSPPQPRLPKAQKFKSLPHRDLVSSAVAAEVKRREYEVRLSPLYSGPSEAATNRWPATPVKTAPLR